MKSLGLIKKRIGLIESTKKITRAMNLISAAKIRRQRNYFESINNFCHEYYSTLSSLMGNTINQDLFRKHKHKSDAILYVVFTSSLGLCGAYNNNVCKEVLKVLRPQDRIIVFGKKGYSFFKNARVNDKIIFTKNINISKNSYYGFLPISYRLASYFTLGEYSQIKMVYTKFISQIKFNIENISVLPFDEKIINITKMKNVDNKKINHLILYEPSKEDIINKNIATYTLNLIYGGFVESVLCEYASRRNAMDSAYKNATDLINSLTLQYNEARQEKITQEINEIVAGANANE